MVRIRILCFRDRQHMKTDRMLHETLSVIPNLQPGMSRGSAGLFQLRVGVCVCRIAVLTSSPSDALSDNGTGRGPTGK